MRKQSKSKGKLSLEKRTVIELTNEQMQSIRGGYSGPACTGHTEIPVRTKK
jgi:hypothetical protein